MYNLMKIDDAFKKALDAYTRYDTKTVVKSHGERFDPEKGLAMAIVKYLGGDHYYKQIIKKWTSHFEEVEDA